MTHGTLGSKAQHGLLVDVVGCNAALHAAADGGDGWQRSVLLGAAVVQPTALCPKELEAKRSITTVVRFVQGRMVWRGGVHIQNSFSFTHRTGTTCRYQDL